MLTYGHFLNTNLADHGQLCHLSSLDICYLFEKRGSWVLKYCWNSFKMFKKCAYATVDLLAFFWIEFNITFPSALFELSLNFFIRPRIHYEYLITPQEMQGCRKQRKQGKCLSFINRRYFLTLFRRCNATYFGLSTIIPRSALQVHGSNLHPILQK